MGCAKVLLQTCCVRSSQRSVPQVSLRCFISSRELWTALSCSPRLELKAHCLFSSPSSSPPSNLLTSPASPLAPGLNPKQGWGEQRTGSRLPSAIPALHLSLGSPLPGGSSSSSGALTSHLARRKLCLLSPPWNTAKSAFPAAGDLFSMPKGSPVLLLPTGLWPSPRRWSGRDIPIRNFTLPLLLAIWRMGFYFLRQTAGVFKVKFLLPTGKP